MADIATRTRRALLAVLVLALVGGAATYLWGQAQVAPETAADRPVPSAAPASLPPNKAQPESKPERVPVPESRKPGQDERQQPGARTPDSAVHGDSVFVDPAAIATSPGWDPARPPTCAQWRGVLSAEQQTSYATALLRAAWTSEGSAAIPFGSTVRAYRSAMTAACLATGTADDTMVDVARALYAADPAKWGP
jgi:hypothetical protein